MPEDTASENSMLVLNTKLEEDFVSPLTAVRGSLEILRDYPDLTEGERQRFVQAALAECRRLEKGVRHLATTVHAAGQRFQQQASLEPSDDDTREYASRMRILEKVQVIEVDLSDLEFSSSHIVNGFYNVLERLIRSTGRRWYLLVNYRDCSIWPEAWIAFAHRAKRVRMNHTLGTVRYAEGDADNASSVPPADAPGAEPDMFPTRDLALAHIDDLRHAEAR